MTPTQPSVQWKQVGALTAVMGAITLMWVVYNLYLPQLLTQVGLPPQLGLVLLAIENMLAIAIEPLMGNLSDRSLFQAGTKFPLITFGVIVSSALFITLPAMVLLGQTNGARAMAVLLIVAWSLAMTIFHSPVLSLLFQYGTVPQLPLANSLLTLVSGLIGTAKPLVNQALLGWGAGITFLASSIALLGAATVLRSIHPRTSPPAKSLSSFPSLSLLGLIGAIGLTVGWGSRFVMGAIPKIFQGTMPSLNTGSLMFWVAIALAVSAVPAGLLASTKHNGRAVLMGLVAANICFMLITFTTIPAFLWLLLVGLLFSLSLVFNGAIPLALCLVPPSRVGLGIGMYLGGLSAATFLFNLLFQQPAEIGLTISTVMGIAALGLAAVCVLNSLKLSSLN